MIYNEQKLSSFSNTAFKYEIQKIIDTHHAIREALNQYLDKNKIKEDYSLGTLPVLDVYLQGSYKNSTNVTKSSDVDVVIQMKTIWRANKVSLPPEQLIKYDASYVDVNYSVRQFKFDIQRALSLFFGNQYVTNDNKCIKIAEHGKYCDADVIPCFSYREYGYFQTTQNQSFEEGMFFYTNDNSFILNYPKQHYDALTTKSENTNGGFKETVRMFKNIKDDLIDRGIITGEIVKSYFIENLLYNVPNLSTYFNGSHSDRFRNILEYLIIQYKTGQINSFMCANGIDSLVSESNWRINHVQGFLIALIKVRDEN